MKFSVVCPFYNEELIIEKALQEMLANLAQFGSDWELVLVNDGSTDSGGSKAQIFAKDHPQVKLIQYPVNQGRGHAIKRGIDAAQGEIIITTEIDLSWGSDIIGKILDKFKESPGLDVVVASPNISGGGYRNVPIKRVLISRLGNQLIRILFTRKITMNTGMTRGYQAQVIKRLRTFESGKEFHLEVLLKLHVLKKKIGQVPAILEWKGHKLTCDTKRVRKSSSNIPKIMFSHLQFAVFANPIRYFWFIGGLSILAGVIFGVLGLYSWLTHSIAIYYFLLSVLTCLTGLVLLGFGILTAQAREILKEIWMRD